MVALWQNYEDSPELDELGKITRNTVNEWREILLAFRLKVDNKYGTTLCVAGSGNWFKDTSKKVVWLKEKEDILELRRKLGLASDTITVLVLAAIGRVLGYLAMCVDFTNKLRLENPTSSTILPKLSESSSSIPSYKNP